MTTHPVPDTLRVVLLAGGVGGAKLADGLARILPPAHFTVIGNTGDDFRHFGLTICPDLDTVMYTLAGVANPATGWGRADESWRVMETVRTLDGPDWFNLGDRDLATHLLRTYLLDGGQTLTEVTDYLCRRLGAGPRLLPMSDRPTPTLIETADGMLPFQEWFVKQRWQPRVQRVHLPDDARATPQAIAAVQRADVVIIAPSNPFVSIDPILNAYPLRALIADVPPVVVAVTPIIGGDAVKGPSAKMLREWELPVSPLTVARHYDGLITGFVYDNQDAGALAALEADGLATITTDTWMRDTGDRERLARDVIAFATALL